MYYIILVFLVLHLSQVCLSVSAQARDKSIATKDDIIDVILKELYEVKQHLGQEISVRKALQVQLDCEISHRNTLEVQLGQEISERKALQVQLDHEISQRRALETQLGHLSSETNKRINELEHKQSLVYVDNNTLVEEIFQVPQIETIIAFAVRGPQDEAVDPGFEGTLLFQDIVTNLGDYYNEMTGQFTCPVSGLYFFSYNILGNTLRDGQHNVGAYLRINDVKTWFATCSHNGSDNAYMNCGATVVLQCDTGSKVEVYKQGYNIDTGFYSWFTGFLIRQM